MLLPRCSIMQRIGGAHDQLAMTPGSMRLSPRVYHHRPSRLQFPSHFNQQSAFRYRPVVTETSSTILSLRFHFPGRPPTSARSSQRGTASSSPVYPARSLPPWEYFSPDPAPGLSLELHYLYYTAQSFYLLSTSQPTAFKPSTSQDEQPETKDRNGCK
jgi:hypothetical protein